MVQGTSISSLVLNVTIDVRLCHLIGWRVYRKLLNGCLFAFLNISLWQGVWKLSFRRFSPESAERVRKLFKCTLKNVFAGYCLAVAHSFFKQIHGHLIMRRAERVYVSYAIP